MFSITIAVATSGGARLMLSSSGAAGGATHNQPCTAAPGQAHQLVTGAAVLVLLFGTIYTIKVFPESIDSILKAILLVPINKEYPEYRLSSIS